MNFIKKIFILQSFSSKDKYKSGELLANELSAKVPVEFYNVYNALDLDLLIKEIKKKILLEQGLHVLHFDCHGNEDGIGLYDKNDGETFIPWEDLRENFRSIYESTHLKPIISFSCCKGINVMKLLAQFEPCPYDLVTGSLIDIPFLPSVYGYRDFYINLTSKMTLEDNILQIQKTYPELNFFAFNAITLSESAWKQYESLQLTPERIKQRKAEILEEVRKQRGYLLPEDEKLIDSKLTTESGKADRERFMKIFLS